MQIGAVGKLRKHVETTIVKHSKFRQEALILNNKTRKRDAIDYEGS